MTNSVTHTYDISPLNKAIFGFVGALLTAITLATYTQVNSSNIEIVKIQTELVAIKEKITANKDITEDKLKDLNSRVSHLEERVTNLEPKR